MRHRSVLGVGLIVVRGVWVGLEGFFYYLQVVFLHMLVVLEVLFSEGILNYIELSVRLFLKPLEFSPQTSKLDGIPPICFL